VAPGSTVRLERDGPIARVTLARPEVRNAFNAELIAELHAAFDELAAEPAVFGLAYLGFATAVAIRAKALSLPPRAPSSYARASRIIVAVAASDSMHRSASTLRISG